MEFPVYQEPSLIRAAMGTGACTQMLGSARRNRVWMQRQWTLCTGSSCQLSKEFPRRQESCRMTISTRRVVKRVAAFCFLLGVFGLSMDSVASTSRLLVTSDGVAVSKVSTQVSTMEAVLSPVLQRLSSGSYHEKALTNPGPIDHNPPTDVPVETGG